MDAIAHWVGLLTGLTPLDLILAISRSNQETLGMPQKAYVVHQIPGRLRLRVPDRQNDTTFFEEVVKRFATCTSVREVAVNARTASILVHYETDLPTLLLEAREADLSELADVVLGLPPLVPLATHLTARLHNIDGQISRVTHDAANGSTLVILGLLLAGGLQVLRGHVLGSAVPLLWYAWQAVSDLPTQRG